MPADLAFSLLSCPHPPTPFPSGEGGDLRLFYARGFAPCIPGAVPGRHWLSLPSRYPVQGEPEVRRKNDRTAFLLAVPSAKERGDRGRWNYPSQATAAFEMVLSPGAGRASAAGVQPPLRTPQRQGKQVPQGGQAPIAFSTAAGRTSAAQGSATPPRTTAAEQTSAAGGQAPIAFSTAAGTAGAAGGKSPHRYHLFPSPSNRRTRKTTP